MKKEIRVKFNGDKCKLETKNCTQIDIMSTISGLLKIAYKFAIENGIDKQFKGDMDTIIDFAYMSVKNDLTDKELIEMLNNSEDKG